MRISIKVETETWEKAGKDSLFKNGYKFTRITMITTTKTNK